MKAPAKRIGIIGNAPGGNYLAKVLELLTNANIERGSIGRVDIFHDEWCAIYAGQPCNCNPDIRAAWEDQP